MKSRSWWTSAMTLQVVVLAAILAIHYWHVIVRLVYVWSRDGDWSHGFIIPLFSIYYLIARQDTLPRGVGDRVAMSRFVGGLVLVGAFLLYVYATFIYAHPIQYFRSVALVISIMGVVVMVCGWPVARWGWFAVAFLIFAIPLPVQLYQDLTMPLRRIAATVSSVVLSAVPGMMVEPHGTVVSYDYAGRAGTLDVERACSGMRLLMTMTALGIAMTFFNERPMWQRLVMILACLPIAVFCNIIRVTTTGFFVVFGRDEWARGMAHTLLGLGMLAIAFSLYGGISYVLNHLFVESGSTETEGDEVVAGGMTG